MTQNAFSFSLHSRSRLNPAIKGTGWSQTGRSVGSRKQQPPACQSPELLPVTGASTIHRSSPSGHWSAATSLHSRWRRCTLGDIALDTPLSMTSLPTMSPRRPHQTFNRILRHFPGSHLHGLPEATTTKTVKVILVERKEWKAESLKSKSEWKEVKKTDR